MAGGAKKEGVKTVKLYSLHAEVIFFPLFMYRTVHTWTNTNVGQCGIPLTDLVPNVVAVSHVRV